MLINNPWTSYGLRPMQLAATAGALLLCDCAHTQQSAPTRPVPVSHGTPPPDPEAERSPEPGWARLLEGLSLHDLDALVPADALVGNGNPYAIGDLHANFVRIIQGGNPERIDPGQEAVDLAWQLANHGIPPFDRIRGKDINRYLWDGKREDVRKEFGLSQVQHPIVRLFDLAPVHWTSDLRGLPAFDQLADVLPDRVSDVRKSRTLKVLYPGSGSHIAPLVTAFRLIDQDVIDEARFVYTEIEPKAFPRLVDWLTEGAKTGIFEGVSIGKAVEFSGEGSERSVEIRYRGKTVHVLFALKRSGEDYFRDEYLEGAHLIVIHDPMAGRLTQSFDLLAQILVKKQAGFPDSDQLVIMEGDPAKPDPYFGMNIPKDLEQAALPGPYGHCTGVGGVGEVSGCNYRSARTFLLNDPSLGDLVKKFPTAPQLSDHLYYSKARVTR